MSELREFLKQLDERGDLLRIKEPLSPRFEIPAALQRFDAGRALIFEKVKGYDVQVVGGVCGTRDRIMSALGIEREQLYPKLLEALRKPTKCSVGDGPVKEVVEEGDLTKVPVLTHFDGDPGPFITSGILYARSPRWLHRERELPQDDGRRLKDDDNQDRSTAPIPTYAAR